MTDKTILFIDDDSDLLHALGERCRHIGLQAEHARNLLTATRVIQTRRPDLVCVDVNLPTGNGLRFCEMLAGDPQTAHLPMIVLTGQTDAETLPLCARLGAYYVPKLPDVWTTLEPLIRRLIDRDQPRKTPTVGSICRRDLPATLIPPLPDESGTEDGRAAANSATSTKQIVIADDDTDLVRSLSERCSALGCSVIGVNSALEAIGAIDRILPDLVLLDVNMPSGNGLSVCEMMATNERLRAIPVIVLTGCSDARTIRRCHDMLVFYVQKGADVWSRVEPLLCELLHLDASHPGTDATAMLSSPGAPSGRSSDDSRDTLMDAVFAMLGSETDVDAQTRPASTAAEPPWVLCIDDDADFSDALRIRLEECGVAVVRAFNGMEGVRLAFSSPASAILLDYNMPNGKGDYVLDRLKNNPVTKDIPVLVVTGVKDRVLERRMLAMGAAGFLNKPVDFEQLRNSLANHIDILAAPVRAAAVDR